MTDTLIPWAPFRAVFVEFVGAVSTIYMAKATRELTRQGIEPMTALKYVKAANATTYAIEKMMEKIK